jgi:phenylalanine-4-hydroxylase
MITNRTKIHTCSVYSVAVMDMKKKILKYHYQIEIFAIISFVIDSINNLLTSASEEVFMINFLIFEKIIFFF